MTESIFELSALKNTGETVDFDRYRGQVLLVVNTASKCGFTPQYQGLEALYRKYHDRGFSVIGFPCNQFGHQEPGSDSEIAQFCEINFGVTFPLMSRIDVNGKNAHPVFIFLKARSRALLGSAIKWNFTKFLVSTDGKKVTRYAPSTKPEKLESAIEKALQENSK